MGECSDGLGSLAATMGDVLRAAPLWAASQRMLGDAGVRLWDAEATNSAVDSARSALGSERFDAAWQAGRTMTREQTLAHAKQVIAEAQAKGG